MPCWERLSVVINPKYFVVSFFFCAGGHVCVCKGGCMFALSTLNLCEISTCHELTLYNA